MKSLLAILAILGLSLYVSCASQRLQMDNLRSDDPPPEGWEKLFAAPKNKDVVLLFSLKMENLDELDRIFWEVSDPDHANYGKHLTFDQLGDLIRPRNDRIEAVKDFLELYDVPYTFSPHQEFVTVPTTVEKAQEILDCEFFDYFHGESKTMTTTCQQYSLPVPVVDAVDMVTGLGSFNPDWKKESYVFEPSFGQSPVVPKDVRAAYKVSGMNKASKNGVGVSEFQNQYYAPTDLKKFTNKYLGGAPVPEVHVVGTNEANKPGLESTLDIQYIGIAGENTTTYFYYTGGNFFDAMIQWASTVNSEKTFPYVTSVSYGDDYSVLNSTYVNRVSTEFQKMGAKGISVIFSSGDSGVSCIHRKTQPEFPATSVYVTAVGGTTFKNGGTSGTEIAVTQFPSGGGFSWHFTRPSYQTTAVNSFLSSASKLPPSDTWNKAGRAIPDVAALGQNMAIIYRGREMAIGGTSASAPIVGGIIGLLNSERLSQGKPPLGFLNPWIYKTAASCPTCFTDILEGNNNYRNCEGFNCQKGWDPVTGLGTPVYSELLKHI